MISFFFLLLSTYWSHQFLLPAFLWKSFLFIAVFLNGKVFKTILVSQRKSLLSASPATAHYNLKGSIDWLSESCERQSKRKIKYHISHGNTSDIKITSANKKAYDSLTNMNPFRCFLKGIMRVLFLLHTSICQRAPIPLLKIFKANICSTEMIWKWKSFFKTR